MRIKITEVQKAELYQKGAKNNSSLKKKNEFVFDFIFEKKREIYLCYAVLSRNFKSFYIGF